MHIDINNFAFVAVAIYPDGTREAVQYNEIYDHLSCPFVGEWTQTHSMGGIPRWVRTDGAKAYRISVKAMPELLEELKKLKDSVSV